MIGGQPAPVVYIRVCSKCGRISTAQVRTPTGLRHQRTHIDAGDVEVPSEDAGRYLKVLDRRVTRDADGNPHTKFTLECGPLTRYVAIPESPHLRAPSLTTPARRSDAR